MGEGHGTVMHDFRNIVCSKLDGSVQFKVHQKTHNCGEKRGIDELTAEVFEEANSAQARFKPLETLMLSGWDKRAIFFRDAPPAAHTWAARRAPSASAGWERRLRRAGARSAALATRRRRHTHGPHGAISPPAPAGEGGRVARASQRGLVGLVPPRSLCAAGSTHMGRTVRGHGKRRLGRAVASCGRHSASSSRRARDAPPAAHTQAGYLIQIFQSSALFQIRGR